MYKTSLNVITFTACMTLFQEKHYLESDNKPRNTRKLFCSCAKLLGIVHQILYKRPNTGLLDFHLFQDDTFELSSKNPFIDLSQFSLSVILCDHYKISPLTSVTSTKYIFVTITGYSLKFQDVLSELVSRVKMRFTKVCNGRKSFSFLKLMFILI